MRAPASSKAISSPTAGPATLGFYLCTLCAVDIVTSWTELEPVWGKGQERVGSAIHHARQRLPMPLLGWDSDSGSEFINELFWHYCQREGITFTRGRAYRKNDGAHVEQKNGAIVRRWVGYDRYTSKAAYAALRVVYRLLRLHVNFFQPVQKLVTRVRVGRRVRRVYDRAQTPYQRLCATGVLKPEAREALEQTVSEPQPAPAPPATRRRAGAALGPRRPGAAPSPRSPAVSRARRDRSEAPGSHRSARPHTWVSPLSCPFHAASSRPGG